MSGYKGKTKRLNRVVQAFVVDEDGFGPSKLTQQIYSLPPLATRELVHMVRIAGLEPV